jgi:glycosyltransferase involved in cell wall biosynthesis
MNSGKNKLSVAIITLNEQEMLPDCLASVRFAAEVVVVDSGSSDRTVDIAREHGARVFSEAWRGYGPQKQFAIDCCSHRWVLVLDADERISPATAAEIEMVLQGSPRFSGYSFSRRNHFCGKWIRRGGWWPDRVIRLFDREICSMSSSQVHESVEVPGEVGVLASPIHHFTDQSYEQRLEKINRYSTIWAEERVARGPKGGGVMAALRGSWAFLWNYIFRLGLLDGSEGLTIALSEGAYTYFKYMKLARLIREQKK